MACTITFYAGRFDLPKYKSICDGLLAVACKHRTLISKTSSTVDFSRVIRTWQNLVICLPQTYWVAIYRVLLWICLLLTFWMISAENAEEKVVKLVLVAGQNGVCETMQPDKEHHQKHKRKNGRMALLTFHWEQWNQNLIYFILDTVVSTWLQNAWNYCSTLHWYQGACVFTKLDGLKAEIH